MFFDSHAHLDDAAFDAERDAVIDRARAASVVGMVTVGTDVASARRAVEIASRHSGVWAAIGIHPHESGRVTGDGDFAPLRELASARRVVAIGETGLDYYKGYAPVEAQKENFRRHLRLARERGLPVVLHVRDAHGDVRAIVREELPLPVRGVIHCFSGTARDAEEYLSLGFTISFAGPVTFRNAERLREAARTVPPERALVETDCPYLAPEPHRGRRNEPAYVRHTAEAFAALHGLGPEEFARRALDTAANLFGIAELVTRPEGTSTP